MNFQQEVKVSPKSAFSGHSEIPQSPVASSTAGWWRAGLLRFVMARQRIATVSGHLVDIISYNRY